MGWIHRHGSGRSPREGNSNPFQYSCPGNPMDRGDWEATVCGVSENLSRLSTHSFHVSLSSAEWTGILPSQSTEPPYQ